jgi:hypothetical protein
MRIIQILFGKIPGHLQACVDSIISYAQINGFEYSQITSIPLHFTEPEFKSPKEKFLWRRHISDWTRTKELSTIPHTFYVDWDVFLYTDFLIKDLNKPCFGWGDTTDCLMYNGDNLEIFKEFNNRIETPSVFPEYNLSRLIDSYCSKHPDYQRYQGHCCHLDNCRFHNCYDLYD